MNSKLLLNAVNFGNLSRSVVEKSDINQNHTKTVTHPKYKMMILSDNNELNWLFIQNQFIIQN